MKQLYRLFIACLIACLCNIQSYSQIPKHVTYQGHLLDNLGQPVDGLLRMTFTLYDDLQSVQFVHQETQDVSIDKGLYAITLGASKPFAISFDKQLFLSITIDGTESSRIPFSPSPFAIHALGVANASVYSDDINIEGSKNGEALISNGKSMEWMPIISKITGDGAILPIVNGSEVFLSLQEGSLTGSKFQSNSLDYERLRVPKAPKDKQYLAFDGVRKTLIWVDPPSLTIALPYKQDAGFTDTLFSIRNTRNGPAGRFVIETNPGTHHALIGENNGNGSAIAGFAKGNGSAGFFSLNNPNGTGSAVRIESNAKKHGLEISMMNQNTAKTSGIVVNHQSIADSITGIYASLSASTIGKATSAIRGEVQSSGSNGIGIQGVHSGKGIAIMGSSQSGIGILGMSKDSIGIIAKHSGEESKHPAMYVESGSQVDSAHALHAIMNASQLGIFSSAIYGEIPGSGNHGSGVIGRHHGAGSGVEGHSQQGIGIRGISSLSHGIYGVHSSTTGSQSGVFGVSSSLDSDASGISGVIEQVNPGIFSAGVKGINNAKNTNGYGVYGMHAGQGPGVYGTSQSGPGIQAFTSASSIQGIGMKSIVEGRNATAIQARTNSAIGRQYGVDAIVAGDSAIAIRGKAPVNSKRTSFAGLFEGNVKVQSGDLFRTYQSSTSSSDKRIAPIAFGSIQANGSSSAGTENYACYWDVNTKQYFITIHAEAYTNAGYVTVVNAVNASEPIIITTNQAGADILAIACYSLQGQKVQTPFHFMVYKP